MNLTWSPKWIFMPILLKNVAVNGFRVIIGTRLDMKLVSSEPIGSEAIY